MWQFEAGRRRGDVSGEYVERDGRVVVVGTYLIVVVLPSRSSLRAPSNSAAVAIIASKIYVLSIRFRSVQFMYKKHYRYSIASLDKLCWWELCPLPHHQGCKGCTLLLLNFSSKLIVGYFYEIRLVESLLKLTRGLF